MRILVIILSILLVSCKNLPNKDERHVLKLNDLNLSKIPDSVFSKIELTHLDLSDGSFVIYPPLSAMIDTTGNHITEIPEKIAQLINLRYLNLAANNIRHLPNSIVKLKKLEYLDLTINVQYDIYSDLEKLKQLPNLKKLILIGAGLSRNDIENLQKELGSDVEIVFTPANYPLNIDSV